MEDLIQERVAAYLATQRETLLGQMTQRMKNVQISNDSWKDQVKELQVKVTDVTVLNLKHEKRKAATAALKVRYDEMDNFNPNGVGKFQRTYTHRHTLDSTLIGWGISENMYKHTHTQRRERMYKVV